MQRCPIDGCGRAFDLEVTLLEHVKRRHALHYQQFIATKSNNSVQQTQAVDLQINKLPKLQRIIPVSKEKKNIDFHRRSLSKGHIAKHISQKQLTQHNVIPKNISSQFSKLLQNNLQVQKKDQEIKIEQFKRKNSQSKISDTHLQKGTKIVKPRKLISIKDKEREDLFYSTTVDFKTQKSNKHVFILKQQKQLSQKKKLSALKQQKMQRSNLSLNQIIQSNQLQQKNKQKPTIRRLKLKCDSKTLLSQRLIKKDSLIQSTISQDDIRATNDQSEQLNKYQQYFIETVTVLKMPFPSLTLPAKSATQYLFANNCSISYINLNSVSCLREVSLQHNNLSNTQFLSYAQNYNITKVSLDHNLIKQLTLLPTNIKVLTASFNKIEGLKYHCEMLFTCRHLTEIDLSFNPIKKEPNYKLQIVGACGLIKVDGMKVTKIDIDMSEEYKKMLDQERGLLHKQIPRIDPQNYFHSNNYYTTYKDRPSTAITNADTFIQNTSYMYNQDQIKENMRKLQKIIKQTEEHLKIIKMQNKVLEQQNEALNIDKYDTEEVAKQYRQLRKQCEALQLLNYLKFADEQQLEQIIKKKKLQE